MTTLTREQDQRIKEAMGDFFREIIETTKGDPELIKAAITMMVVAAVATQNIDGQDIIENIMGHLINEGHIDIQKLTANAITALQTEMPPKEELH